MKSVVEHGFYYEFAFDNKANFESVENVQSSNDVEFKFELRHISSTVQGCSPKKSEGTANRRGTSEFESAPKYQKHK